MIRKKRRRSLPLFLLVFSLLFSLVVAKPAVALAEQSKVEAVFGLLDASGTPLRLFVVNHFQFDEAETVVDYGDYQDVTRLMEGGTLTFADDRVTIEGAPGRYYYQGELVRQTIPWDIAIRYTLDGKEVTAAQLAGQSGRLAIEIAIQGGDPKWQSFVEHFVLQISLTMPFAATSNVVAEEGTLAMTGDAVTVQFMNLPNQENSFLVTADAQDFYMPGIQISAVPLAFDFDFADYEDQIGDSEAGDFNLLLDAIQQLSEGGGSLSEHGWELEYGFKQLSQGMNQLALGAREIKSGSREFADGTDELSGGFNEYMRGILTTRNGTKQLVDGLGELAQGVRLLASEGGQLSEGAGQLADGVTLISEALSVVPDDFPDFARFDFLMDASSLIYEAFLQLEEGFDELPEDAGETFLVWLESLLDELEVWLQDGDGLLSGLEQLATVLTDLAAALKDLPDLAAAVAEAETLEEAVALIEAALSQLSEDLSGLLEGLDEGLLKSLRDLAELAGRLGGEQGDDLLLVAEDLASRLEQIAASTDDLPQDAPDLSLLPALSDESASLRQSLEDMAAGDAEREALQNLAGELLTALTLSGSSLPASEPVTSDAWMAHFGLSEDQRPVADTLAQYASALQTLTEQQNSLIPLLTDLEQQELSFGAIATGYAAVDDSLQGLAADLDLLLPFLEGLPALTAGLQELSQAGRALADETKDYVADVQSLATGLDSPDAAQSGLLQEAASLAEDLSSLLSDLVSLIEEDVSGMDNAAQLVALLSELAKRLAELEDGALDLPDSEEELVDWLERFLGDLQAELEGLVGDHPELQTYLQGFQTLVEGLRVLQAGLSELGEDYEIEEILDMLAGLGDLGDLMEGMKELKKGLAELKEGSRTLADGLSLYVSGVGEVAGAFDLGLTEGMSQLLSGLTKLARGGKYLAFGVDQLADGGDELALGLETYADGSEQASEGGLAYAAGLDLYLEGLRELAQGLATFELETADLETTFRTILEEQVSALLGGDYLPVSFASDRNDRVESVQFVFMTEAIEKP